MKMLQQLNSTRYLDIKCNNKRHKNDLRGLQQRTPLNDLMTSQWSPDTCGCPAIHSQNNGSTVTKANFFHYDSFSVY